MPDAFGADVGDGLHEQRQAAWRYAVRNPSAEGGVWSGCPRGILIKS